MFVFGMGTRCDSLAIGVFLTSVCKRRRGISSIIKIRCDEHNKLKPMMLIAKKYFPCSPVIPSVPSLLENGQNNVPSLLLMQGIRFEMGKVMQNAFDCVIKLIPNISTGWSCADKE